MRQKEALIGAVSLLALEMGLSAGGEKSFSVLGGRLLESLCLPKDW